MHLGIKITLKSNRNHIPKQTYNRKLIRKDFYHRKILEVDDSF
jgi:hypothetical protein